MSNITTCISTYNNLPYLKLAIQSVRKYSYFSDMPFVVYAENCDDGTDEWLEENAEQYNLTYFIEHNKVARGIGGGMNFCADKVKTKYINFIHSDFFVSKNWDIELYNRIIKTETPTLLSSHRIEPSIFRPTSQEATLIRPGTLEVPLNYFGGYHNHFDELSFIEYAQTFSDQNDFEIRKAEGVSFMIEKEHWDHIGGNDSVFAPSSYEDMDLFLRMINEGYDFILTSKSVVWHFGARGSHRLEENDGKTSERQRLSEEKNIKLFYEKWGGYPKHDKYGMICGIG